MWMDLAHFEISKVSLSRCIIDHTTQLTWLSTHRVWVVCLWKHIVRVEA